MMLAMTVPGAAKQPRLAELARELGGLVVSARGNLGVKLAGLRQDSRRVLPGEVFAARSGSRTAGREVQIVEQAVLRGAAALLVGEAFPLPRTSLPVLEVSDVRRSIALAAEAVYGFPSRALSVIGITGTNGKTTTALLVAHALEKLGRRAATLGTLGFSFDGEHSESELTTPEADEIARRQVSVLEQGGQEFVMEVSSHALSQARVDGVRFAVAGFSNLSQDHLDYYPDMASYAAAKRRLFTELLPGVSVLNIDDALGAQLALAVSGHVVRVGRHPTAQIRALGAAFGREGLRAEIETPSGSTELSSSLVGEHNLENLLLALGILFALGIEPRSAAEALGSFQAVPGRLERCSGPDDDILVMVDYAHTPDALARVLRAVGPLVSASGDRQGLVCVFGCGGDRDREKRPKMGRVVGELATRAVITSDNPRSEDPRAIAEAVELGLSPTGIDYAVELDRRRAIEQAIAHAAPGEVIVIAGKGHEPYQLLGSERRPFDDRVEARRALALRRLEAGRLEPRELEHRGKGNRG